MNIDIIPGAYNFISMMCGSEVEARIYHGEDEICKTTAEAIEAAELLKAFFEAKQEGKDMVLIETQSDYMADLQNARRDGYKSAMKEKTTKGVFTKNERIAYQKPAKPSDYQLRLERYAVDIYQYQMDETESADDAVNRAAKIMALAAEKAREHE